MEEQRFTDEQMQHLVNIVLSCERWAKLEAMKDGISELGYMDEEAAIIDRRSRDFNKYMISEMIALSGRDEEDLFINDIYSYQQDVDKI